MLPCLPKKCPEGADFFPTFSFYLSDTMSEIFGIRAFAKQKSQAISQQDMTRSDWISIVKHQIENRE